MTRYHFSSKPVINIALLPLDSPHRLCLKGIRTDAVIHEITLRSVLFLHRRVMPIAVQAKVQSSLN